MLTLQRRFINIGGNNLVRNNSDLRRVNAAQGNRGEDDPIFHGKIIRPLVKSYGVISTTTVSPSNADTVYITGGVGQNYMVIFSFTRNMAFLGTSVQFLVAQLNLLWPYSSWALGFAIFDYRCSILLKNRDCKSLFFKNYIMKIFYLCFCRGAELFNHPA